MLHSLELGNVLGVPDGIQPGKRLAALSDGYIQIHRDEEGSDPISAQVKAHKWLAAEIALGASRYFHHEGRWFEIGDQYLEGIRHEVDALLAAPAGVTLFDWTSAFKEEMDYNEEARIRLPRPQAHQDRAASPGVRGGRSLVCRWHSDPCETRQFISAVEPSLRPRPDIRRCLAFRRGGEV